MQDNTKVEGWQSESRRRATDWLGVIRSAFIDLPDLELTRWQAQRLWNLDAKLCDALLDALVNVRFLRLTTAGTYARRRTAR